MVPNKFIIGFPGLSKIRIVSYLGQKPGRVASSGTSLTEGQIRLIKRNTQNIVIVYDGDTAGIKAALRGIDLILEQDMNVKVMIYLLLEYIFILFYMVYIH